MCQSRNTCSLFLPQIYRTEQSYHIHILLSLYRISSLRMWLLGHFCTIREIESNMVSRVRPRTRKSWVQDCVGGAFWARSIAQRMKSIQRYLQKSQHMCAERSWLFVESSASRGVPIYRSKSSHVNHTLLVHIYRGFMTKLPLLIRFEWFARNVYVYLWWSDAGLVQKNRCSELCECEQIWWKIRLVHHSSDPQNLPCVIIKSLGHFIHDSVAWLRVQVTTVGSTTIVACDLRLRFRRMSSTGWPEMAQISWHKTVNHQTLYR